MNPVEIERYVDYELSGNSKTYIHEELWQFVIEEMILPKKTRGKQEM
ncbi:MULTISPECIES: hypothetical protein [Bacillus]|nr:hypothetical protein [Bacillus tropicus]